MVALVAKRAATRVQAVWRGRQGKKAVEKKRRKLTRKVTGSSKTVVTGNVIVERDGLNLRSSFVAPPAAAESPPATAIPPAPASTALARMA